VNLDGVLADLAHLPASPTRESYLSFVVANGQASFRRDSGGEHLTASCFVFSPDFDHTLLCFHRKGRFWVQFGGHIESDDRSIADSALREAREESGIRKLTLLSESIADLDRHELNGGFSCRAHWDVGFVAVAATDAEITVSEESDDVRWFPTDALPARVAAGLSERLDNVLRHMSTKEPGPQRDNA
jgi:8-oxo-dGTP pyrophosphatase MutT (NUDIX family)